MKIIYNTNEDGSGAAALISLYLRDKIMEDSDFFPSTINYDELPHDDKLVKGETWYILGIPYSSEIAEYINHLIENDVKVVHIDHHPATIESFDLIHTEPVKKEAENFTRFYIPGESTAMLSWLYVCMTEEERKEPEKWDIAIEENNSSFEFNENPNHEGKIRIPFVVRYLHDNEAPRTIKLPDTTDFIHGLSTVKNTHPNSPLWKDLFTSERRHVAALISNARSQRLT